MSLPVGLLELLRLEESRLGVSVEWDGGGGRISSADGLLLRGPANAETRPVTCELAAGRERQLVVADDHQAGRGYVVPITGGDVWLAVVDDTVVHVGVDLADPTLIRDRELLNWLWDFAVGPALRQAARHFGHCEHRNDRKSYVHACLAPDERLVPHRLMGAERRFDDLVALVPRLYRSIRIEGDTLLARTGPVRIEHEGKDWLLGEYEIGLDLRLNRLRVENLTLPRGAGQHPHLVHPEDADSGALGLAIPTLMALGDHAAAFAAVHRSLHSFDADTALVPIELWRPEPFECFLCAGQFITEDGTLVQGRLVCGACLHRDVFRCRDCRLLHPWSEELDDTTCRHCSPTSRGRD